MRARGGEGARTSSQTEKWNQHKHVSSASLVGSSHPPPEHPARSPRTYPRLRTSLRSRSSPTLPSASGKLIWRPEYLGTLRREAGTPLHQGPPPARAQHTCAPRPAAHREHLPGVGGTGNACLPARAPPTPAACRRCRLRAPGPLRRVVAAAALGAGKARRATRGRLRSSK